MRIKLLQGFAQQAGEQRHIAAADARSLFLRGDAGEKQLTADENSRHLVGNQAGSLCLPPQP